MSGDAVRISAPARLHFGFMDPGEESGRAFGGLGMAIDAPALRLEARPAAQGSVRACGMDEALAQDLAQDLAQALAQAARRLRLNGACAAKLVHAIPRHAGLGSGTQTALAAARVLALVNGRSFSVKALAVALGRGRRSGIGVGAFARGGVLLDGGKGLKSDAPPPVIIRLPFPRSWRVLLLCDRNARGLHGASEEEAFRNLAPYPAAMSDALRRRLLGEALPALAEASFAPFARFVTFLQQAMGQRFSVAQGGRFASGAVAQALAGLARRGVEGYGQSSWGPTGFALFPDREQGEAALREMRRDAGGLDVLLCRGRNHGAVVAAAPARRAVDEKVTLR